MNTTSPNEANKKDAAQWPSEKGRQWSSNHRSWPILAV
jgi:hypothetical protein